MTSSRRIGSETRIVCTGERKIHFPAYKDALGKVDGTFVVELLKTVLFPLDLKILGTGGISNVWDAVKLRGADAVGPIRS